MFDSIKKIIKDIITPHPKVSGMSQYEISSLGVKEEVFWAIWFAILAAIVFGATFDVMLTIIALYISLLHYRIYSHKKWLQQMDG